MLTHEDKQTLYKLFDRTIFNYDNFDEQSVAALELDEREVVHKLIVLVTDNVDYDGMLVEGYQMTGSNLELVLMIFEDYIMADVIEKLKKMYL